MLEDQYQIIQKIGEGGAGEVLQAKQLSSERMVAIKLLAEERASDDASIQRFQREAKTTCSLNHPNIIKVFSYGLTKESRPYFVMEYLEGKTLSQILKSEKRIDLHRFAFIFTQVCSALEYAHSLSIVHRDIKPSNIMLVRETDDVEIVKLLDFGIARKQEESEGGEKITKTGHLVGSPAYMSPEQCKGQKPDIRSDIYSLACVMYECLCGSPPFQGDNSVVVLMQHLNEPAPPMEQFASDLELPTSLRDLVMTCLSKNPDDRVQSAKELSDRLQSACAEDPVRLSKVRNRKSMQAHGSKVFPAIALAAIIISAIVLSSIFMGNFQFFKNGHIDPNNFWVELDPIVRNANNLEKKGNHLKASIKYKEAIDRLNALLATHPNRQTTVKANSQLFYCLKANTKCLIFGAGSDENELEDRRAILKAATTAFSNTDSLHLAEAKFELARVLLKNPHPAPREIAEAEKLLLVTIKLYQDRLSAELEDPIIRISQQFLTAKSNMYACYALLELVGEKKGDADAALTWAQKALELKREPGDKDYVETLLAETRICRAYHMKGDIRKEEQARVVLFTDTASRYVPLQEKVFVLSELFEFYLENDDIFSAQQVFDTLKAQVLSKNHALPIARVYCLEAKLHQKEGKPDEAFEAAELAKIQLQSLTLNAHPVNTWYVLRSVYEGLGRPKEVAECQKSIQNLLKP